MIFIDMKKCKNIECENNISDYRTYCSLTCRNIYVNKHIRDYSKVSNTISQKYVDSYEKNKKHCLNPECGKEIPYEKKRNNYCNSSCSTSHNNTKRICTWGDSIKEGVIKYHIKNGYTPYKICGFCGNKFSSRNKYCSIDCYKNKRKEHIDEYIIYKLNCKFKFDLSNYPNEFEFYLIEKYGWYKAKNNGNNLGGVSRDHMLSVNEGYKLGIDPYFLSHPANCKLMIHTDNIRKNKKSSITKEELIERVKNWDIKYPK
jgi:hypothetical protein